MKKLFTLLLLFACAANTQAMKQEQQKLNSDLVEAAQEGDSKKIKKFLKQGADVNACCGLTPLTAATLFSRIDTVTFLLKQGAQINKKDDVRDTALLKAILNPNDPNYNPSALEIVELLLKNGANPNIKKDLYTNHTPLHVAADYSHGDIIKLLLRYGADSNAVDKNGDTPLHWAATRDQHVAVTLLLLGDADPTIENKKKKTPYQAIFGSTKLKTLLQNPTKIIQEFVQYLDKHPHAREHMRPMFIGRACTTRGYKPNGAGILTMLRDRQIGKKRKNN